MENELSVILKPQKMSKDGQICIHFPRDKKIEHTIITMYEIPGAVAVYILLIK